MISKVSEANKYNNNLMYSSKHNFNKSSVSNFNEIYLILKKFFYKDFKKLESVKSETKETNGKKINVLKNASLLYDKLVDIYKKEYDQTSESKDEGWRLKHDYKNLKDLDY